MRRIIAFIIVGIAVVAAAWGLAKLPGHVTVTVGTTTLDTPVAVAIPAVIVLFAIGLIILRLLGGLARLPRTGARWRQRYRIRAGERSVTRVLVALAAGEQRVARKEARRARTLLGESPQTLLLIAEAGRMSGREDEAEQAFRALTKKQDAQFLGFRGLLRQAVDRRDWSKAQAIAREAEAAYPGTTWLRQQRADLALQTDNWAEAAELSGPESPRAAYFVAAADAESDPDRALGFARQALKIDPDFVPAVLAVARRLRAMGQEKRAQAVVAEGWRRTPHPDLAEFALATELDPKERFFVAKRLVGPNATHPESRLLITRVAVEAGMNEDARYQADAALADGINQRRLWLLIAELEEQERGETEEGRKAQRDALRRAAIADPDPTWRCDMCRSDHRTWSAKCSSCGAVGSLRPHTEFPVTALSLPIA